MEYFESIPEDILLDILIRVVPTESVLGCKSVCKAWRKIISYHPSFSKMHLHHINNDDSGMLSFTVLTQQNQQLSNLYYFEYNQKNHDPNERMIRKININIPSLDTKKNIIGSCNGLICLEEEPKNFIQEKICVCNPITREYVRLPEIKTGLDAENDYLFWSIGFGYVSSTDEYKVVQIMFTDFEFVQVHVYTLGSGNGWRNLGIKRNLGGCCEDWGDGIFCNGNLYWLYLDLYKNDRHENIVTFDLADEKFCEHISLPPLPSISNYELGVFNRYELGVFNGYELGVFNGFLIFAVGKVIHGVIMGYDIWLLRNKNDSHDMEMREDEHQSWVWSREFRVENSKLFGSTKTDDVLTYSKSFINIVDQKASTSKILVNLKERILQVLPHKNTLVSLKELGEGDTKIMEPIEAIINH